MQQKMPRHMLSLKGRLEALYKGFDFTERLQYDPIAFPRRYAREEDREIAGFVAACFAYGKVSLFTPVVGKILQPGGDHLAEFIGNFSRRRDRKHFRDLAYRFQKEEDILGFIMLLQSALQTWGSLKKLFYHHYDSTDIDIQKALNGFVKFLLSADTSSVYGKKAKPSGLIHLLPSPDRGSACKRMNLFLRWMVRRKDIDLGLWDQVSPSQLIIPLDTHIYRISRCLGLTRRRSADWKTAQDITQSLKKMDPDDPLKYDFALCHQGISGQCRGETFPDTCHSCSLALA